MDPDKFKQINDTFGHAEGNQALKVFAEGMKAACREPDIYTRLGGDKFAMLLIHASREQAEEVVARLHESVEKYYQEAKRGYAMAFSHGIVEFNPEKQCTIEAMLAEGDSLMYALKKTKR